MKEEWSFEIDGAEIWEREFFDTKKAAIEAGRKWAKEEGLIRFCVGRKKLVPIPTSPDIEDIFNRLDEQYYYECSNPNMDCMPFYESDRKENEAARERLEEKISKALKEYVEETGITESWYKIEDVCIIYV